MNRVDFFERYYRRIKKSRRKYFFEKSGDLEGFRFRSFIQFVKWMKSDIVYVSSCVLNALLNVRKYGKTIGQEYSLSYFSQFIRLLYLRLVLRSNAVHYRTRLLFKQKNWRMADEIVMSHAPVQKAFIRKTYLEDWKIIKDKFRFYEYCSQKKILTPQIIAMYDKGERQYVGSHKLSQDLFLKYTDGAEGKGAEKILFRDGKYINGECDQLSEDEVWNYIARRSEVRSVILQPALENHDSWKIFTSGSLVTCRLVTARQPDDLSIQPLFAALRMAVGNLSIDNYSAGGIAVPVDIISGTLGVGVSIEPLQGKYEHAKHPDTNYSFVETSIPLWKELLDFTLAAHSHFKTVFVGWDVSLTSDGWCLIEGNGYWSAGSYEIPSQDTLKNTLYPELFERWINKIRSE